MGNYLQIIETYDGKTNDNFNEDNREQHLNKTIGGYPISAYDSFVVKGGGITSVPVEGISKIKHLYVPVGLVMFPHTTLHCQNIHKNTEADILEDTLFDKLFQTITKHTSDNHRKTKKLRGTKVPSTLPDI